MDGGVLPRPQAGWARVMAMAASDESGRDARAARNSALKLLAKFRSYRRCESGFAPSEGVQVKWQRRHAFASRRCQACRGRLRIDPASDHSLQRFGFSRRTRSRIERQGEAQPGHLRSSVPLTFFSRWAAVALYVAVISAVARTRPAHVACAPGLTDCAGPAQCP